MERGGIIESLTKVFVRILKERPEDPTQYLLQNLGDARLQADNIAYLQSELENARSEILRLTEIIRNINPDLLNEDLNNDSLSNDNLNNFNPNDERDLQAPQSHNITPDQNHQAVEYSEVVTLEEGLQNTHISDATIQSTEVNVVQNDQIASSTE